MNQNTITKTFSLLTFGIAVLGLVHLIITKHLLSTHPVGIIIQILAAGLMVWARITLRKYKMKQYQILKIVFFTMICLSACAPTHAQTVKAGKTQADNNEVKKEITAALELWNSSAKSRDMSHFMELFDNHEAIIVVGSDSGEVFKGKQQIEGWMKMLFAHRSFSWEMKRVDIDHNGNTAWVFMDGSMIVTNDKGKTAKFPYRFTGILVKVKSTWKWRLFDGSVPGGH